MIDVPDELAATLEGFYEGEGEPVALRVWDGDGAVRLLDHDRTDDLRITRACMIIPAGAGQCRRVQYSLIRGIRP
ncbi:hypothetical protein WBG99_19595 [Streptomyces sp. TG1A-60]|uniref:hypothetical protein n=1 Tax=Streptomyces sp. TG1A-60 TaxID=3129111 RepID=UPI0030D14A5B